MQQQITLTVEAVDGRGYQAEAQWPGGASAHFGATPRAAFDAVAKSVTAAVGDGVMWIGEVPPVVVVKPVVAVEAVPHDVLPVVEIVLLADSAIEPIVEDVEPPVPPSEDAVLVEEPLPVEPTVEPPQIDPPKRKRR